MKEAAAKRQKELLFPSAKGIANCFLTVKTDFEAQPEKAGAEGTAG